MANPPSTPIENPTLDIKDIIQQSGLDVEGQKRVEKFFLRDSIKATTRAQVDLKILQLAVQGAPTQDEKVIGVISSIALGAGENGSKILQEASTTPAWRNAKLPNAPTENPVTKPLVNKEEKGEPANKETTPIKRHGGGLEGGIDNEITTLRGEITNMLKKDSIVRVPGSERLIAEYSKKLNEPGITSERLKVIRDSLNQIQSAVDDFDPKNAQDIIDKVNSYQESREKTNEGTMMLYGAIVRSMYTLGFRLKFDRSNTVTVEGGGNPDEAASLNTAFSGKKDVVEWLKRGLVLNTSKWTHFMNSYPSQETATVDKYISTFGEGRFNGGPIDEDFLNSSSGGGFDIKKSDGTWEPRGMNIHTIAVAAQEAAKKWKEMGYQTPIQKSGGAPVQFMDMAYNVAKFGFAAASVWKGTKAIWKTIFGDETAMKAAWGDFGKTLAWTGAVWYGGEAVKRISNDFKSNLDLPNYTASVESLSTDPGKAGMYDGFSAIWKKIGGGVMPGVSQGVLTPGVEYLLPSTVPGYQFKDMWESLCTGRKGDQFRNARITDLSKALENSYHAKKGSHVGGLKVFFEDMGQWGKDFYDKFLINDKTGDNTRKFLRAIADYRSDDSFQGANDAIPNRDQTIATLFETPLAKKTEVPGNIDKEMDTFNKSLKEAGYATLRILPAAGELGADVWKVTMDGVEYLFHLPKEILKSLTPEEVANLTKALKVLGVAGAVGAGVWGITLLPSLGMLGLGGKILGVGALLVGGGYAVNKLISLSDGSVIDKEKALKLLLESPLFPQGLKDTIKAGLDAKKKADDIAKEVTGSELYKVLPAPFKNEIDDLLKKVGLLGSSDTPSGDPTGVPRPGSTPPPAPTPDPGGTEDRPIPAL